jgi:outer membrane biosynthesis protein TonB
VKTAPPTPLTGAAASRAHDRVPGTKDTPFPAGLDPGFENTLARQSQAKAPEAARSEPPPTDADAVPHPGQDALRAVMRDALRSEKTLLTGKREPADAGTAAGTTPNARTTESPDDTGALQFGDFEFSTTEWNWEPYWQHMRTKLYANWNPPAAYKDYGIIQGGWTLVRVVLDRNGRIRTCKIIGEQGHASLHPASFGAMQGAAPFRPLPGEFPEDSLVVTVRFMYLPPGVAPGDPRPAPPGTTSENRRP